MNYTSKIISLFLIFAIVFFQSIKLNAAEVLQVRTSSLLQIGDQNRTYSVKLPCISVDLSNEEKAVSWLRKEFPRRQRVNLKPMGSDNGQLIARVSRVSDQDDISSKMISIGLASNICTNAVS